MPLRYYINEIKRFLVTCYHLSASSIGNTNYYLDLGRKGDYTEELHNGHYSFRTVNFSGKDLPQKLYNNPADQ
jgi:hypothetical protein